MLTGDVLVFLWTWEPTVSVAYVHMHGAHMGARTPKFVPQFIPHSLRLIVDHVVEYPYALRSKVSHPTRCIQQHPEFHIQHDAYNNMTHTIELVL
jgi:hypothetical protein